MPKNITLSIPDELGVLMDSLSEVSWSAVARDSIENYIRNRNSPEIAGIVSKIQEGRSKEYQIGFSKMVEFLDNSPYSIINDIMTDYQKSVDEALDKKVRATLSGLRSFVRKAGLEDSKKHDLMVGSLFVHGLKFVGNTTIEFKRGLFDAIQKIWNELQ